ncbi:histone-like nucleoid-structuring protein Lsr2 [Glycomyces paridis]|uniref:Lsr2 family protein n=1 Tax=Glycomyces paridis TaxID=2126555 RepID=A0A4S8P793_9ACTN|nr:Lsr2 family protein [Glycomyces paridis]THV24612.1 Lsr2 family protein [Glycomyces paridis]
MAKQTVITLTDDIDGSEAAESVEFGIDGQLYTIDLSSANAEELRDRLTAYQEFGTRLGAYSTRTAPAPAAAPKRSVTQGDRDRNASIRRWAEAQGLPIKARGKISDTVISEYNAAHA